MLENVGGLKEVYGAAHKKVAESQLNLIEQIGEHLTEIKKQTDAMMDAKQRTDKMDSIAKKAKTYCETVKPFFEKIRNHADALERLISDDLWPLTKYRELLFVK